MMAPLLDQQRNSHSNVTVTPYEDLEVAGPSIGAAGTSNNILEIARKQAFIQKENTLKPGTWKQNIVTKKVPQHRDPSFKGWYLIPSFIFDVGLRLTSWIVIVLAYYTLRARRK